MPPSKPQAPWLCHWQANCPYKVQVKFGRGGCLAPWYAYYAVTQPAPMLQACAAVTLPAPPGAPAQPKPKTNHNLTMPLLYTNARQVQAPCRWAVTVASKGVTAFWAKFGPKSGDIESIRQGFRTFRSDPTETTLTTTPRARVLPHRDDDSSSQRGTTTPRRWDGLSSLTLYVSTKIRRMNLCSPRITGTESF